MNEQPNKFLHSVAEVFKLAFITALIVVPIRTFVAQPFIVSGSSMEPTFQDGEYLIVDELSYHLREPRLGEVIIFRFPRDPDKFFIKRIVGAPGDTVDSLGKTVALDTGEYFVEGDNRGESYDSRSWGILPREYIIGRAFLRLFPLNRLSVSPGQPN